MKNSKHSRYNLLKNIRKVVFSRIIGFYFRLISSKHADEILSPLGSLEYGGRYNPPGEFGALYIGETREVCEAERNRKTKDFLLVSQITGKIKVSCEKVLDLTDPKTLKKLGIKKEELLREEKDGGWDLTWNIARLAYQFGIEAILAPSITGVGNNLVIFDKYIKSGKVKLISKREEKIS